MMSICYNFGSMRKNTHTIVLLVWFSKHSIVLRSMVRVRVKHYCLTGVWFSKHSIVLREYDLVNTLLSYGEYD